MSHFDMTISTPLKSYIPVKMYAVFFATIVILVRAVVCPVTVTLNVPNLDCYFNYPAQNNRHSSSLSISNSESKLTLTPKNDFSTSRTYKVDNVKVDLSKCSVLEQRRVLQRTNSSQFSCSVSNQSLKKNIPPAINVDDFNKSPHGHTKVKNINFSGYLQHLKK